LPIIGMSSVLGCEQARVYRKPSFAITFSTRWTVLLNTPDTIKLLQKCPK